MLNLVRNGSRCLQLRNQQQICPRISSLNHLVQQKISNLNGDGARYQSSLPVPAALELPEQYSKSWSVVEQE